MLAVKGMQPFCGTLQYCPGWLFFGFVGYPDFEIFKKPKPHRRGKLGLLGTIPDRELARRFGGALHAIVGKPRVASNHLIPVRSLAEAQRPQMLSRICPSA